MTRRPLLALLLLGPLLAEAGSVLDRRHDYRVTVDERFEQIQVTACFEGRVPSTLLAGSNDAARLLRQPHIEVDGEREHLSHDRNLLRIHAQPDDGCVHYRVDLGLTLRSGSLGIGSRTGESMVISPRVWLWRPRQLNRYIDIHLRFDLPEGFHLSAPWTQKQDEDGHRVHRLGHPPPGWDASIGIGPFDSLSLEAGQTRLETALMDGPGESLDPARMEAWLQSGLEAAVSIYGDLPTDRIQAILVPLDLGERPVSNGRVSRAGGPGLLIGVGTGLPESDFQEDGLMAHEFMHLLHPPVAPHHAWLSEGIASYYQYIGLARAGYMSEETAWRHFMEDMDDGFWDRRPGTLLDVTRRRNRQGGANYVYWSGAALMLMSDVALRQRSDGEESLDHILARWAACCFDARRGEDGRDALERLDGFTEGEALFRPLYDEYVLSAGFPDIEELLEALGLPALGEDFALDDEAPLADIRRAIMQPREERLLPQAKAEEDGD